MKFKIKFNKTKLFKKAKIKEQFLSHSKDKIENLFNEIFEVKDYKGQPIVTTDRAKNIKDYKITKLFGSSQVRFFKVVPIDEINKKGLTDLKICNGRITEKPTTKKDLIKWLNTDRLKKQRVS